MTDYATVTDVQTLWRPLTADEQNRAGLLITVISASLRTEAKKVEKDLDQMIEADPDLAIVAKSVTVDVVARTLMTSTDQEPMTQYSESALGYTVSGTFLTPGGGLFIKRSELARLGLGRPRYRAVEIYNIPRGGPCGAD